LFRERLVHFSFYPIQIIHFLTLIWSQDSPTFLYLSLYLIISMKVVWSWFLHFCFFLYFICSVILLSALCIIKMNLWSRFVTHFFAITFFFWVILKKIPFINFLSPVSYFFLFTNCPVFIDLYFSSRFIFFLFFPLVLLSQSNFCCYCSLKLEDLTIVYFIPLFSFASVLTFMFYPLRHCQFVTLFFLLCYSFLKFNHQFSLVKLQFVLSSCQTKWESLLPFYFNILWEIFIHLLIFEFVKINGGMRWEFSMFIKIWGN
jgi:hypothetical protein